MKRGFRSWICQHCDTEGWEETYKNLTGKYDRTVAQIMPQQQHKSTSLPTQGHNLKLYLQRVENGLRQNFLTIQVANLWNGLPAEVIEAPTVAVFERRLDVTLKAHEWKLNFKSDCSPSS